MAARNHPPTDIRDAFALHVDASAKMKALVDEAVELQRAGKIRQARAKLAKAEKLRVGLEAIEAEMQHTRPGD